LVVLGEVLLLRGWRGWGAGVDVEVAVAGGAMVSGEGVCEVWGLEEPGEDVEGGAGEALAGLFVGGLAVLDDDDLGVAEAYVVGGVGALQVGEAGEAGGGDGVTGGDAGGLCALVEDDGGEHPEVVVTGGEGEVAAEDVVVAHEVDGEKGDRGAGRKSGEGGIEEVAVGGLGDEAVVVVADAVDLGDGDGGEDQGQGEKRGGEDRVAGVGAGCAKTELDEGGDGVEEEPGDGAAEDGLLGEELVGPVLVLHGVGEGCSGGTGEESEGSGGEAEPGAEDGPGDEGDEAKKVEGGAAAEDLESGAKRRTAAM
jgi:hypothetical protein